MMGVGLSDFLDFFVNHSQALLKFGVSFILGAVIGWERESKNKPIGVKTCIIIAVTSCMLTQVSIQSAEHYAEMASNIRTDPMRLAAQVISGVGFLGAGVIMHRQGDNISGLTTAAIIWASAGIGIACGSAFYMHAAVGTLLLFLAIRFSYLITWFKLNDGHFHKVSVSLVIINSDSIYAVTSRIRDLNCYIDTLNILDSKKGKIIMKMKMSTKSKLTIYALYTTLKSIEGVCHVALDR